MSPFHKQMYMIHNLLPIILLGPVSNIEDCRSLLPFLCPPQIAKF